MPDLTPKELINKLQIENEILKHRLEIASKWMRKEIEGQVHKIAKRKVGKMTEDLKESFLKENIEEMIAKRIESYFGDILLLNAPNGMIEAITTSEINYFNMKKNPTSVDGFSVVSGYHKSLDLLIESSIINNFRKFAKKNNQTILRQNDPLEKALHLVVTKKYILSVGRVYGLLKAIRTSSPLYDYGLCFKKYLDKYSELRDILLSDEFFSIFDEIITSEILGAKRHSGMINFDETNKARELLIGNFENKNSIIYRLIESTSTNY